MSSNNSVVGNEVKKRAENLLKRSEEVTYAEESNFNNILNISADALNPLARYCVSTIKAKEFDEWVRRAHKTFRAPVYDLSLSRD